MRIVISTRFYRNGQTTHVFALCEELLRQGHDVFLIISRLDCPSYKIWLEQKGIPYCTSSDPAKISRILQRWKPDLIHNHSIHTLPTILALKGILRIPTLTTIHYLNFKSQNLLYKQEAIVVISKEMQEKFTLLPTPVFLVENGIPIPTEGRETKSNQKQALFLARVSSEKEENFRKMTESLLSWNWEIKSAGNWRYPGIISLGWVANIWPLLKQTNLVIGTGRAIREGMAAGCATWVLGQYCDGLVTSKNVVTLEATNFSGRNKMRPFSSTTAAPFLEQPNHAELRNLGHFGRKYAQKNFSIQNMIQKLEEVYNFTLKNYSRAHH